MILFVCVPLADQPNIVRESWLRHHNTEREQKGALQWQSSSLPRTGLGDAAVGHAGALQGDAPLALGQNRGNVRQRRGPAGHQAQQAKGLLTGRRPGVERREQHADDGHGETQQDPGAALTPEVIKVGIDLQPAEEEFDVAVATHKTIDLVVHTQVYKLKRNMRG